MMTFAIWFLTVVMVLICVVLILLVLMQLPKKEAGAGLAFGAGATDALFGSGSGNFLTKATRNCAIAFFVLAIFISVLQNHSSNRVSALREQLGQQENQPVIAPAAAPTPQATAPAAAPGTNGGFELTPAGSNATSAPK
jgi:preprotein translocase subunit SecG